MLIPGDVDLTDQGSVRAFIGVPLPPQVTEHLTDIQQGLNKKAGRAVRWNAPETMHLTLEFLGEVPRWVLQDLPAALGPALEGARQVELATGQLGAFPNWSRPQVIWLGIDGNIKALGAIRRKAMESLREFAFSLDPRPFRPHLTLGRVRPKTDRDILQRLVSIAPNYPVEPVRFVADTVVLYRSVLSPEGPTHYVITEWRLGA